MFERSLAPPRAARKRLTLSLALVAHAAALSLLVLLPLVYTEAIGSTRLVAFLAVPGPPQARGPSAPASLESEASPPHAPAPAIDPEAMIAPAEIPRAIEFLVDGPRAPAVGLPDGVRRPSAPGGGGLPTWLQGSDAARSPAPPPPPPPPPPPSVPPADPVRLSGRVVEGYLLSRPRLEYPALARDSRTEGTVVIEAVISREGRIRPETVRVLSGHPILARAASTAILEWEYQPYLLGGVPIEVITTITVRYTMGGGL